MSEANLCNFTILLVVLNTLRRRPSMSLSTLSTRLQSWDSIAFASIESVISVGNTRFYVLPSIVALGIPHWTIEDKKWETMYCSLLKVRQTICLDRHRIQAATELPPPWQPVLDDGDWTCRIRSMILNTLRAEHSIEIEDLPTLLLHQLSFLEGFWPEWKAPSWRSFTLWIRLPSH